MPLPPLPKVELHVHLEGAILPSTLLDLAQRHHVRLPARTEAEVTSWFKFQDFPHFAKIYQTISRCIQTTNDL